MQLPVIELNFLCGTCCCSTSFWNISLWTGF